MRENPFLDVENATWETLSDVDLVHTKDFLPSSQGTNLNLWIRDRSLFKQERSKSNQVK